ncbi:MAG: cytochrome c oxidase accessory protein CcoG [Neptuniibacter sp.]
MEKIPLVQEHPPPFSPDGKLYVKLIEGRFQSLRRYISWPMIVMFFSVVWVQIDGHPWVLFSFENRVISLFGLSLSWHDLPLLSGFMITGGGLLFVLSVGWGRVWCGFACPQSIWTWIFIRIEQWTEGRSLERAKRDQQTLTYTHLLQRVVKHLVWLCVAGFTAITFTGYFVPIREILADIHNLQASPALSGWIVIMSALTYLNAGLVREKICLHACPYSRFQGVMFDSDTLTVSYDVARGEPRAQLRGADENSGDCVDCDLCVQVCPTGIDIRDGLQAACIDCAACIDACDSVMSKLKRPKGLIRFASENELTKKTEQFMRPRLMGYVFITLTSLSMVMYGFKDTTQLLVEVRRDRTTLFTQLENNRVCNRYLVKVENFVQSQQVTEVSIQGDGHFELFGPKEINLQQNNSTWIPYRVCAVDMQNPKSELNFRFSINDSFISKGTTFLTASI